MNGSESHDSVRAPPARRDRHRGDGLPVSRRARPGAYWRNIAAGVDAVDGRPRRALGRRSFLRSLSSDDDRVYSKRGGYLPTEIPFDPLAFGIMPVGVAGGEVDQFLVLKLVDDASRRWVRRGRPSGSDQFILGRGNYLGPRQLQPVPALRRHRAGAAHPQDAPSRTHRRRARGDPARAARQPARFRRRAGTTHIPNVVTGRAANRLDLMGRNYTVERPAPRR